MGPLIPMFWTSGDVSSGFQSQSGQPFLHLAEVYMLLTSDFEVENTFERYLFGGKMRHLPRKW